MSELKMREEFEVWAQSIGRDVSRYDDGGYGEMDTEADWFAWQASRAALVIELPQRANGTTLDLPGSDGENDYLLPEAPVRKAIEAAGLKVKP